MNSLIGLNYVAHAGASIRWHGPKPDEPLINRGRCYCGAPIALVRHVPKTWRWTLSHDEVELVSADEYMLIADDNCRAEHNHDVGLCLLRDVLMGAHAWLLSQPHTMRS